MEEVIERLANSLLGRLGIIMLADEGPAIAVFTTWNVPFVWHVLDRFYGGYFQGYPIVVRWTSGHILH